jgi:predicted ribosomally synthesized peptide with nif11-like leader
MLAMSTKGAGEFLEAVSQDETLREKFSEVTNPQEFLDVCEQLGYRFTTEELRVIVKERSEGILVRRNTGVWKWLRSVNWL